MRDYKQTLPHEIKAKKTADDSQPTWTILNPKTRQFNFKEGETLEYHPLNDRAGHIVGFYRLADMIAFQDRLTRKYDWRLTHDLDNDTLTISLIHDDMTDSPTVTIPLYAATKERHDALKNYQIAYQERKKQEETAENDPNRDRVTDSLPAGRTMNGTYQSFCSNVYQSLRPFNQKTQKHYLQLETDNGKFYFPLAKIIELTAILRPARSRDDDPVLSFSVTLDMVTEDIQQTVVSNDQKEFNYKKRWIKRHTIMPSLTIKSDGPVRITANVKGIMDRPMVINKEIIWSLPGLLPVVSDKLSALMDAVVYLINPPAPARPETQETAVAALETALDDQWLRDLEFYAENYGTLETAPARPETQETAVAAPPAAIALETAPARPETQETAVAALPAAIALETAPARPETQETAVAALPATIALETAPARKRTKKQPAKKQPAWRDNARRLTRDVFSHMMANAHIIHPVG